jgi:hypothetical protein
MAGLKIAKQMNVDRCTIRRILKEDLNVHPFKKTKRQFLTEATKKSRKERCQQLISRLATRNLENWMFVDEKLFTIEESHNPQNVRVYSQSKSNLSIAQLTVEKSHTPKGVMVFAGVSKKGKPKERGVRLTGERYLNEVLIPMLLPDCLRIFGDEEWCLIQDSAPCHRANIVQCWIEAEIPHFIRHNEWPPNSPDLNPMDFFVWGKLHQQVSSKSYTSVDSLKREITKCWNEQPQEEVCAAVDSFPHRLRLCVRANGSHFK